MDHFDGEPRKNLREIGFRHSEARFFLSQLLFTIWLKLRRSFHRSVPLLGIVQVALQTELAFFGQLNA